MRPPEGVQIAGQPLDAYPAAPEATPPVIVRFARNRTA